VWLAIPRGDRTTHTHPYLANVKFLRPYRTIPVNDLHRTRLLDMLAHLEAPTPARLLAAVCQDRWQQAQILPTLWQLVATGRSVRRWTNR